MNANYVISKFKLFEYLKSIIALEEKDAVKNDRTIPGSKGRPKFVNFGKYRAACIPTR